MVKLHGLPQSSVTAVYHTGMRYNALTRNGSIITRINNMQNATFLETDN